MEENDKSTSKENDSPSKENFDDLLPNEILESIPPEERGSLINVMLRSYSSGISSNFSPYSEKITSEHLTKIIENSDSQDKRDRLERKSERIYNLLLVIVGVLGIGTIIIIFKDDKDTLITIIGILLGFLGGFGFGKTKRNN